MRSPDASGLIHRTVVAHLCEKGCRAKGFAKKLRKETGNDEFADLGIVPDAWSFEDGETPVWTWYEVEDTHPVNSAKMQKLAMLWCAIDYECHELRLVVVDRFFRETRVDLEPFYWAVVRLHAEAM